jgi:ankyrin repeat protein
MCQQRGLDVNWVQPDNGATAAYVSAMQGHAQCLSVLAQHGADLSKAAKDGTAPIHLACQNGRYASLEVLLDNHVDSNLRVANEIGDTPAIIATQIGHVKLLALLLDRKADPNLANRYGTTAAHIACQNGHLKCLQLLRERNANLDSQNEDGETPLDIARMFKRLECIDLLLAAGASGMPKENLRPVSEAHKVRVAASFSVSVATRLSPLSYLVSSCSLHYSGKARRLRQ